MHPLFCKPREFPDFIDAWAKWDTYVAMDAPVWSVNLVAVVLLVLTYPVAEAVARLVLGRALTPRDLTVRLMQRWFLRPEAHVLA